MRLAAPLLVAIPLLCEVSLPVLNSRQNRIDSMTLSILILTTLEI